MDAAWLDEFPGAVTVCDRKGTILAMNAEARAKYEPRGAPVGSDVLACHPEPSRTKLASMLAEGTPNVYTVERAGTRTLVYQVPWFENGVHAGIVELLLPLPGELPHHVRD